MFFSRTGLFAHSSGSYTASSGVEVCRYQRAARAEICNYECWNSEYNSMAEVIEDSVVKVVNLPATLGVLVQL